MCVHICTLTTLHKPHESQPCSYPCSQFFKPQLCLVNKINLMKYYIIHIFLRCKFPLKEINCTGSRGTGERERKREIRIVIFRLQYFEMWSIPLFKISQMPCHFCFFLSTFFLLGEKRLKREEKSYIHKIGLSRSPKSILSSRKAVLYKSGDWKLGRAL